MINKDINIKVLSNSMIILDKTILGINGENLQGKIIFNFEKFIDGVAWLEIEKETGEKGYIQMTKENETYTLEIKSSLLNQAGYIYMQLRITQDENVNGIAVFKSKKFYVEVLNAINATATIEDDYPNIIDIVNTKQDKLTAGENITIKDNIISANLEGTVNKTYVDEQDTKTLESAKQYADNQVPATVETYVNEHKEELSLRESKGLREILVTLDHKAHKALKELLGKQDLKDHREFKENKDLRENKEYKVQLVHKVKKVLMVKMEYLQHIVGMEQY